MDGAAVEGAEVGDALSEEAVMGVAMEVALGVARKYQPSQHNYWSAIGPPAKRHLNRAFHWRVDSCPHLYAFWEQSRARNYNATLELRKT